MIFDVHHGNGTEDILKMSPVYYFARRFSMLLYPFGGTKQTNDHILNIPIPAGTKGVAAYALKWSNLG
jgi:acetoin utilization deacetylase AcuC-like enzyme